MVGDDQVHSSAARRFRGRERADARVNADDQPHAIRRCALDHLVAHAIALADAMRHMKIGRPTAEFDGRLQNDDRRRAIHVVVAIDENFFFALDRRFQPVQSGFHSRHQQRDRANPPAPATRKRAATSGSSMPRATSRSARTGNAAGEIFREEPRSSASRTRALAEFSGLAIHRMGRCQVLAVC